MASPYSVRKHTSSSGGFSLIELLVVVSIISVLSTVGLAAFLNAQASARDAQRMADMKAINDALQQFYTDNGRYPGPIDGVPYSSGQMIGVGNVIDDLLEPYLETVPQDPLHDAGTGADPISGSLYWYGYDPAHIVHLDSCDTNISEPSGGWDEPGAVVFGFNRAESWGNTDLTDLSTRDIVTCQGGDQGLGQASFNRKLRPIPVSETNNALWTPP